MMDISLSQLADNSVYYLYLADTGQRVRHVKTQKLSLGLIRFPRSLCCLSSYTCFSLRV